MMKIENKMEIDSEEQLNYFAQYFSSYNKKMVNIFNDLINKYKLVSKLNEDKMNSFGWKFHFHGNVIKEKLTLSEDSCSWISSNKKMWKNICLRTIFSGKFTIYLLRFANFHDRIHCKGYIQQSRDAQLIPQLNHFYV